MVIYDSAARYMQSKTTLQERMAAMQAIIIALEDKALEAADTANYAEYFVDSGQTQIRTQYRSVQDIGKAIEVYDKLLQRYLNRLNGRATRMVDGKNFINRYPCE